MSFRLIFIGALLLCLPIYAGTVYMTDSANEFGTLNLVTGVFTPNANQPVTIFGMGFAPNGALYAVDNGDTVGTAYQVDPLTGNLTHLAPLHRG